MSNIKNIGKILIFRQNKSGLVDLFYQREVVIKGAAYLLDPYERLSSWDLKLERLVKRLRRDGIQKVVIISPKEEQYVFRLKKFIIDTADMEVSTRFDKLNLVETQIFKSHAENTQKVNPFINGFRLYLTGLYPEGMIYDGLKHIELSRESPVSSQEFNLNCSIICSKNDNPPSNYYLERINLSKNNGKIDALFESSGIKMELHCFSFSDEIKIYKVDNHILYLRTMGNKADQKKCVKFFEKMEYSGEIALKDCLWLIQDEYRLLKKVSTERVKENRRLLEDVQQIKTEFAIFDGVERYLVNARNIFRSLVKQESDLEEIVKFPTQAKTCWLPLIEGSSKMVSRNFVLFEMAKRYFIYSEVKQKFYEISLELIRILEALYYFKDKELSLEYLSKHLEIQSERSRFLMECSIEKFQIE